jgi:5'(3')-deoxyribonucleotidase
VSFLNQLQQIIIESNQQIIVYLDMDGVLADFGGMKKEMILNVYRKDFLELVKHVDLTEKEKETFLSELALHSQDTSLLDQDGKPKISQTSIKRGEGRFWRIMEETRFFEKLKPLHNNELIKKIYQMKKKYNFKIGILGSTGREDNHVEFEKQKRGWLEKQDLIKFLNSEHIIFVAGKKYKSNYANPTSILIDDTSVNVDNFKKNGGYSILHQNNSQTLKQLKEILEKN